MGKKEYTAEQLRKKYAGKFIDVYPNHYNLRDGATGKFITTYEVRGVNDAVQYVQDLRSNLREGAVPFRAKHYANEIIDSLKSSVIQPYSKLNPEFGKKFGAAEQAWSALHKEGIISNFMQEHLTNKPYASTIMKGLLHGGAYTAAHTAGSGLASSVPLAAVGIGLHQSGKMLKLIKDSSLARTVYGDLMRASLAGNVAAASKSAAKLDKIATRFEEKNPDEQEDEWEIVSL